MTNSSDDTLGILQILHVCTPCRLHKSGRSVESRHCGTRLCAGIHIQANLISGYVAVAEVGVLLLDRLSIRATDARFAQADRNTDAQLRSYGSKKE